MTEKITLDCLTQFSVSILRQEFDDEGNQVGDNVRNAYMNSQDDRDALQSLLPEDKWNELIEAWGDTPVVVTPEPEPVNIEMLKETLIKTMSNKCSNTIMQGFNTELEDGKTYHFSLDINSQLQIQALSLKAKSGETMLPYHADGQTCKFFSVQEILTLNAMMEKIVTYQTTYFNSLRDYIYSMATEEELNSVVYGMEIPVEYQSEVFKTLLKEGSENG